MIKNPQTRRRLSLGLLVFGGVLLALAPENAWFGMILLAVAALLEALGLWILRSERP
jgi:hypothetical protein